MRKRLFFTMFLSGAWVMGTFLKPAMTQEAAAVTETTAMTESIPWNVDNLMVAPSIHPAAGYSDPEAHAMFVDGLPWKGKPTRFFAWYGVPNTEAGKKVPAMVLVHGGGGTAHLRWVKQWLARGYAAIAIDTNGGMPPAEGIEPIPNPQGGPKGSDHCFLQLDDPIQDQWAYHGVANILLAHSFLRSLPNVDADRTGISGISWGGYLTCIAIGVDSRFKFAIPVYGCGYLAVDSGWARNFEDMGSERKARWERYWDPARYLPAAKMPILWLNGDMDGAFSLKITRMSFLLPRGERYLSIQPNMSHSHEAGEAPPEIPVFAEQILHVGRPLARCESQGVESEQAWARFVDVGQAREVRCAYTVDTGRWMGRKWTTAIATWDAATGRAEYHLPKNATAFYFVLTDDRGLMSSSEPVDLH